MNEPKPRSEWTAEDYRDEALARALCAMEAPIAREHGKES